MAGKISLQTGITHSNGSLVVNVPPKTKDIVQTTQGAYTDTQTIGITPTALTVGSIATLGVCVFENLDGTNYVEIGRTISGTFYPSLRIAAGERYPLRLVPGVTYIAQANGAQVNLQKTIYEN